jgi:hypothetical protein
VETKTCRACEEDKVLSAFSKDRHRVDGYTPLCKDCDNARRKRHYRLTNPSAGPRVVETPTPCDHCGEPVKTRRNGAWCKCCSVECHRALNGIAGYWNEPLRKRERRLAEVASGGLTRTHRARLLHRWRTEGKPCWACGGPAETVDHMIPITRGGTSFEGNLAPACWQCNGSRCNRLVIEWTKRPTPTLAWPNGRYELRAGKRRMCAQCGKPTLSKHHKYCQPRACPDAVREKPTCEYEDCTKRAVSSGYCQGHDRLRKLGKPLRSLIRLEPRPAECIEADCHRPVKARKRCSTHYHHDHRRRRLESIEHAQRAAIIERQRMVPSIEQAVAVLASTLDTSDAAMLTGVIQPHLLAH